MTNMVLKRLAWGNKVSAEFRDRVFEICKNFGWSERHPDFLMTCMAFESAGTFSPSIKNAAGSGATGLIQFMPATARGLGTTTASLAEMTAEQQLDFVALYFVPYHKLIHTLSDMYMAILLPKYVGKPEASVLFSGGTAYRQNSGLDADKDGNITKKEATAKVEAKYLEGMGAGNVWWADS